MAQQPTKQANDGMVPNSGGAPGDVLTQVTVGDGFSWGEYVWQTPQGGGGGGITEAEGDARYLQLNGAAPMTGLLTLSGTPTADMHAANRRFVSDIQQQMVFKGGDTMAGALTLSGPPTANLHAASKAYVDANAGGGTYTFGIGLTLTGSNVDLDPANSAAIGGVRVLARAATNGLSLDGFGNLAAPPATSNLMGGVTVQPRSATQGLALDGAGALSAPVATTALAGSIIDAPSNGTPYARQDAGWVPAPTGGGGSTPTNWIAVPAFSGNPVSSDCQVRSVGPTQAQLRGWLDMNSGTIPNTGIGMGLLPSSTNLNPARQQKYLCQGTAKTTGGVGNGTIWLEISANGAVYASQAAGGASERVWVDGVVFEAKA